MSQDDPYAVPLAGRQWVSVYLNMSNSFGAYNDSDILRSTVGFPVVGPPGKEATHGELLAYVYAELNIDEPTSFFGNIYRVARNRSLSVGDVVEVDNTAWAVTPTGWQAVQRTEAQVVQQDSVVVTNPADGIAYTVNASDDQGEPTFAEEREDV